MFDTSLNYPNGQKFLQHDIGDYLIDYIDLKSDTLFVTFDGMLAKNNASYKKRYPWGGKHLSENGISVLGIKTNVSGWYRDKELHRALQSTEISNILSQYKRVVFYGDSMGGYAALAFSSIHHGSEILCYGPQSTLSPRIVPWDNRFKNWIAPKTKWDGDFVDAAKELDKAKKIYIVYDPFCEDDAKHIKRLPQEKIIHLKVPFFDHNVAKKVSEINLIKTIPDLLIANKLEQEFPKLSRKRKKHDIYASNAHFQLACRAIKKTKDINQAIHHAEQALKLNIKNEQALNLAKMLIEKKNNGFVDISKYSN